MGKVAYPIKGFNPNTLIDWEGKLASIIYLPGCNFRCPFCHSSRLVLEPQLIPSIPFKEIKQFLKQKKGWIDGVVIGGGEPTLYEDLASLLKEIKDLGLLVKLDTNGTKPELIQKLIAQKLIDYIALDIKAPLERQKYELAAGGSVDIDKIKKSIEILLKRDINYEFRTTVVRSLLAREDILEIARSLPGAKRYILQQFNPKDTLDRKMSEIKPYLIEELKKMAQFAKEFVQDCFVRGA